MVDPMGHGDIHFNGPKFAIDILGRTDLDTVTFSVGRATIQFCADASVRIFVPLKGSVAITIDKIRAPNAIIRVGV